MKTGHLAVCAVIGLAIVATPRASAQTVVYSAAGTNGNTGSSLAARATLTLDAGILNIDLENIGAPGKADSDALLSLFFALAPGKSLTPVAASLLAGSGYTNTPTFSIGQEWGYATGLSGPGGTNSGVSAAGLGLFGKGNFASNGQTLQGLDYGLTNGVAENANGPYKSAILVNKGVHLELSAPDLSLSDISNVRFHYGTALTDPDVPVSHLPEPGSLALLGFSALTALRLLRKRLA